MSSGWLHTANVINGDIECKAVEYLQGLGPATEQVARKGGANTLMKYVTSNLPKSSLWQRRLASLCAIRCDIDSILAGPFHPLANLALPDYTRRTGATAIFETEYLARSRTLCHGKRRWDGYLLLNEISTFRTLLRKSVRLLIEADSCDDGTFLRFLGNFDKSDITKPGKVLTLW